MFKFKSYNVSKAEKKSEMGNSNSSSSSSSSTASSYSTGTLKKTTASSYSTGTLKKTTASSYVSPKKKTMPSAKEIKDVNNYQPPEYSKKIYPKKTVTEWHSNKTFSAKNRTNIVIPSPKKKLERK